jgi:glucose-1-phosphate thymidylyltransferase
MLGDNIIEKSIKKAVEDFKKQTKGAKILIKKVDDPGRFGVAEVRGNKIVSIEEKPRKPRSDYAVTGIYMYDSQVFDIASTLKPSKRGELEITDVNNEYLRKGELTYGVLNGWWTDSGTFDSLLRANILIAKKSGKAL